MTSSTLPKSSEEKCQKNTSCQQRDLVDKACICCTFQVWFCTLMRGVAFGSQECFVIITIYSTSWRNFLGITQICETSSWFGIHKYFCRSVSQLVHDLHSSKWMMASSADTVTCLLSSLRTGWNVINIYKVNTNQAKFCICRNCFISFLSFYLMTV